MLFEDVGYSFRNGLIVLGKVIVCNSVSSSKLLATIDIFRSEKPTPMRGINIV